MADDSEEDDDEEMARLREAAVDATRINPVAMKRSSDSKDVLHKKFTKMMDERLTYDESNETIDISSKKQHGTSGVIKLLSTSKEPVKDKTE